MINTKINSNLYDAFIGQLLCQPKKTQHCITVPTQLIFVIQNYYLIRTFWNELP